MDDQTSLTSKYFALRDLMADCLRMSRRLIPHRMKPRRSSRAFRRLASLLGTHLLLDYPPALLLRLNEDTRQKFVEHTHREAQDEPVFLLLTRKWPLEAITRYAYKHFALSHHDVKALQTIHSFSAEAAHRVSKWFNFRVTLGLILSGGAFLASFVPDPIIQLLGWKKDNFQIYLFAANSILVAYTISVGAWVLLGETGRQLREERGVQHLCGAVLSLMAAISEKECPCEGEGGRADVARSA